MKHITRRMTEYAITMHSAATALAAPSSATAGGALVGGGESRRWLLSIDGSTTISLTNAILYRYDTAATTWRKVATLATPIALTSTVGYEVVLEDIGGGGRYALGGTLDTGNVTVKLTPLDQQG